MMKSFILAATSIAYILSVASITDAKVKTQAKNIYREQSCLNQNYESTQLSTLDIRLICKLVTESYKKANSAILTRGREDYFIFREVNSLKLGDINKYPSGEVNTSININEIQRTYVYNDMNQGANSNVPITFKFTHIQTSDYTLQLKKINGQWQRN